MSEQGTAGTGGERARTAAASGAPEVPETTETTALAENSQLPVSSGTIVVGHDGSIGSKDALRLAMTLAEKLAAPVVVVRSWSIDRMPRAANHEFGYVSSFAEVSATVREQLLRDVSATVERHPDVPVECRVAIGQAAVTLVRIAEDALMLVVGSRGLGGFSSLMLGSVGDQCVRHATCPVLVDRPRKAQAQR
ncbi:MAG: Universal stress protein family protein [Microbacteriaceae bacterium]|jgi:nucleotide-binding universal stress UspA family protein|nr:Universal stress protein family protein [Microbacteriaceae bacterium]